jgi:hypothetical protein
MNKEYWRNNKWAVGTIYLSAVVIIILALMICLAALGSLIPFKFSALGQTFMLGLTGLGTIWGGVGVWKMGRRASMNTARFLPDGVHFYFGAAETDNVRWTDITQVTNQSGTITVYAVPDRMLSFDAYTFFLPSHLGRAIAMRAGKQFR